MGFILAPNGRWSARDKVGEAAIGGFLFTYVNLTRDFKNTFADAGGVVVNPNPLQLDSSGTAQIYWEDDEFYTIEVWSVDQSNPSVPFELIYTEDNYPAVTGGSGGDVIINQTFPNLVRNAQFTRWGNDNFLSSDTSNDQYTRLGLGANTDTFIKNILADDWGFVRNNANATVVVSRVPFVLGQSEVPANPVNYLNYTCTGIGAGGESFKSVVQDYISVDTLSNQEITVGLWAKSSDSSVLDVDYCQSFGTGGSPSPATCGHIFNVQLTPVWTQYSGTVIVDSVAGETLGTDNNNFFRLEIRLPLNQLANIDLANVQMHNTSALPQFAYLPINDQIKRADTTSINATLPTGSLQAGIFTIAPEGWALCNDSTIGSFFSGASYSFNETINLFILLWNNLPDAFAPIFDSSGTPTTRGASAIDDFNADKRLQLISVLGRVIGASGSGASLTTRALGETLGEENHQLSIAELPAHNHTRSQTTTLPGSIVLSVQQGGDDINTIPAVTGTTGADNSHNTMQPSTFATHMIKL